MPNPQTFYTGGNISDGGLYGADRSNIEGPGATHVGVDYNQTIKQGDAIPAIQSGTVYQVGSNDLLGNYVVTQSGNNFWTFGHMIAPTDLRVGEAVAQGDTLGFVGMTGAATGPHVHVALGVGSPNAYVDPLAAIGQFVFGINAGATESGNPLAGSGDISKDAAGNAFVSGSATPNPGLPNPLHNMADLINTAGKIAGWMADGSNWWRMAFLLGGSALIIMGLTIYVADSDAGRDVIKAGAVAA